MPRWIEHNSAAWTRRATAAVALVCFLGHWRACGAEPATNAPQFERDVLPIFTAHCLKCHGREAHKASLDLRTMTLLARGGESGPVLVPESTKDSPLFTRVVDHSMPPEGELPLSSAQIEVVRRWIEAGAQAADDGATPESETEVAEVSAADREYWAFRKLVPQTLPAVRGKGCVRTPVDAFVLAKLEAAGLSFAPDAEPRTLVMRHQF